MWRSPVRFWSAAHPEKREKSSFSGLFLCAEKWPFSLPRETLPNICLIIFSFLPPGRDVRRCKTFQSSTFGPFFIEKSLFQDKNIGENDDACHIQQRILCFAVQDDRTIEWYHQLWQPSLYGFQKNKDHCYGDDLCNFDFVRHEVEDTFTKSRCR